MIQDIFDGIFIFVTGIIVGFINTLSGSGSLITLPILIYLGVPPQVANGTNRIAILLQTLVALLTFSKQKLLDTKNALRLSIPVIAGAIPGALIAASIPEKHFVASLGVLFLLMAILILLYPRPFTKDVPLHQDIRITPIHYLLFFAIGIYGGYIQAGVGIFFIFALVLGLQYDLIRANAIKLFLTFIFSPFVIFIFWHQGQIDFQIGLLLSAGNIIGAFTAARAAMKIGVRLIRWLVFIMVTVSAFNFFLSVS